mmetsp:Transcript_19427/g.29504  ORF Transcript_19427/g.29504 Transcript_19427/m.29504 type:complete len:83 (+) Transcript_19427:366-614(+)
MFLFSFDRRLFIQFNPSPGMYSYLLNYPLPKKKKALFCTKRLPVFILPFFQSEEDLWLVYPNRKVRRALDQVEKTLNILFGA